MRGIFPFESTPVMRSRKSEKHNNDNAKPSVKIWSLPEELHLRLLEGLPLIDLITMRAVHPVFKDLIDSNPKLWSIANVNGHWPSMGNIRHFERAANRGNVEALIKLGIAYLYDTWDNLGEATTCRSLDQKWHFHETGIRAAEAFRLAESLTPHTAPFTALFLRPPWSANGNYTKTLAFKHLKKMADLNQENSGKILTCVATILGMMEETSSQEEALTYEERAARLSSPWSAFKLWQKKYCTNPQDRGTELEGIRRLRDLGPGACVDARLALCHAYMKKQYGGIPEEQAIGYVHGFVQESHPTWAGMALRSNPQLTNIMRYILIDWLVEVIRMKVFSQRVLHLTVRLVDLFLHRSTCSRSNLQLVGISALVLVSRFQSKEILTVREAAWLTDNTYKYEDVVHMMGEIAATVHGAIYGATTLDFLELFHSFATLEAKTIHLSRYICDLTLLESDVGRYSHAYLAASSVLLSLVMLNGNVTTWLSQMTLHTGLSTRDISLCALHVHKKCLMGRPVIDYRDVTLRSVQEKYSDPEHLSVSCLQPTTSDELCQVLGLDYTLYFIIGCGRPNKRRSSNGDGIAMITSPRGKTCTSRLGG
ncbi:PREDICTED: cyclin-F-like isoform X2 [Priapulus caudatus]|uniref:Cyclin-F n=1 Tax=Priapulus caudatus TaxID=37621 RepID=A0ABM1FBR6_PRICU|nr:PREDICTED: cyclin-F-like isoform X2 [Priapulus caudatus]